MTPEQTQRVLERTIEEHSRIDSVEGWLRENGIDSDTFRSFSEQLMKARPQASAQLALMLGFGLGWTANEVSRQPASDVEEAELEEGIYDGDQLVGHLVEDTSEVPDPAIQELRRQDDDPDSV